MTIPIYLDYNGTTPHDPEVIQAMLPFLRTDFGNPSSGHWYGQGPGKAVSIARKQIAGMLGCGQSEILFTSGGTEANNHALKGSSGGGRGNHIITSSFEHPAILEVCRYLATRGFEITYLPVDSDGLVSVGDVEAAITRQTSLITIMHANNEVGTIQPIEKISDLARSHDILMHTDAAQSVGKIPVRVAELGVDLLSIAGHKLYAPKGVGALYVRDGVELLPFCHGAGQEQGRRAGTENVLEIVGLGKGCEVADSALAEYSKRMEEMRNRLEDGLSTALVDIRFNGHRQLRLPNTCSVSFADLEANRILDEIGGEVAVSAGAACHAGHVEISHVLQAMQVDERWAKGTLRFSTGRNTTAKEIDHTLDVVETAIKKLGGK